MLCRSCGDPVPEGFKYKGLIIHPKCHCKQCYLELVWKVVNYGRPVPTTDTRSGGGVRIMRNEKSLQ